MTSTALGLVLASAAASLYAFAALLVDRVRRRQTLVVRTTRHRG